MRCAVIPAAGLGTRFLPTTKVVPKELLPVFDTPSLQHTLNEAVGAGIEHVIVVSHRAKPAIEAFVEQAQSQVRTSLVYQDAPRGLGHAVQCAHELVGDAAFAVLLPDELLTASTHLSDLISEYEATGRAAVGLKQVPRAEVSAYGCVTPQGVVDDRGRVRVRDVVEKPNAIDAPSNLVIIGRYVFDRTIFGHLAALKPAAGGELQLSDAIATLAHTGAVTGVMINCDRYDTGTPLGMLVASIDVAMRRREVGPQLVAWLQRRLGESASNRTGSGDTGPDQQKGTPT